MCATDLAAGGQLGDLIQTAQRDHDDRAQAHGHQQPRIPQIDRGRGMPAVRMAAALRNQQGHRIDRHDDHRHGKGEEHDQPHGLPAGVVLTFEEVHRHGKSGRFT